MAPSVLFNVTKSADEYVIEICDVMPPLKSRNVIFIINVALNFLLAMSMYIY